MKVLIIVLVIVVVLFIVLAVWGSITNASSSGNAAEFNDEPHPVLQAFDGVLGRFGPKLHLAVKSYDLSNVSKESPMKATAPADPDHEFRTATFGLTQNSKAGCAKIEYKARDKAPDNATEDEKKLYSQTWPNGEPKPAVSQVPTEKVKFTILQSGGTITFTHENPLLKPCVVETE